MKKRWIIVILVVWLSIVASLSAWMIAEANTTIVFAVVGDYGAGNQDAAQVATLIKSWNPEFIISVGDNNYASGEQATIDKNIGQNYADFIYPYHGTYTGTAKVNRFFPSLGNHDWYTPNAQPYLDYFTLPGNERYYDFVRDPVHFFALDSDDHEPDGTKSTSVQANWFKKQIANSSSCWNIVFFHHPPYSSGPHGQDPEDPGRKMTWNFKGMDTDVVLSGHDHAYERVIRDGLPYFINGAGGASLYELKKETGGSQIYYNKEVGAMRVTATRTTLVSEFINVKGQVIDQYSQTGRCARGIDIFPFFRR